MFASHRIVCVTPAGRRRYLKILIPYVLASPLVDEYQLWLNTCNPLDVAFIRACASLDPRIRVIEPPERAADGNQTIGQFFRTCVDAETIYVRFDDDIVFLQAGFFARFLQYRIDHPQYFLVTPLVVNNALCSYLLTALDLLRVPGVQLSAHAFDPVGWQDARFAGMLHSALLDSARAGELDAWHFDPREIALNRFGINCIAWRGEDFATFGGRVPFGDEEEWLTVLQPARLGRTNCCFGGTIVAHFAYGPQRAGLDRSGLLQRYQALADANLGEAQAGRCSRLAQPVSITPAALLSCAWRAMQANGEAAGTVRLRPDGTVWLAGKPANQRWGLLGDSLIIVNDQLQIITQFAALERDANGRLGMQGPSLSAPDAPDMVWVETADDAGVAGVEATAHAAGAAVAWQQSSASGAPT